MKTKDKTLKRKMKLAFYRVRGYYRISINGVEFRVDPYHFPFWRRVARGKWEPDTYTMMSRFINADSVVCDVGAWIGPTVIYAAKRCKKVFCFEPDPVAYRYLRWNIELNELQNVTSFSVALADRMAMQRIASFGDDLGDSMTSMLNENKEKKGVDVLTLTWDMFISLSGIGKIDFLKIDIEGGEYSLLPTLKDYLSKHRPIVHLSTHTPFLDISIRREKMGQVMDVMGMYRQCLNENLQPVDIQDLHSEAALNKFRSYVFLD
jgi:FkbM family methyltransferase